MKIGHDSRDCPFFLICWSYTWKGGLYMETGPGIFPCKESLIKIKRPLERLVVKKGIPEQLRLRHYTDMTKACMHHKVQIIPTTIGSQFCRYFFKIDFLVECFNFYSSYIKMFPLEFSKYRVIFGSFLQWRIVEYTTSHYLSRWWRLY